MNPVQFIFLFVLGVMAAFAAYYASQFIARDMTATAVA